MHFARQRSLPFAHASAAAPRTSALQALTAQALTPPVSGTDRNRRAPTHLVRAAGWMDTAPSKSFSDSRILRLDTVGPVPLVRDVAARRAPSRRNGPTVLATRATQPGRQPAPRPGADLPVAEVAGAEVPGSVFARKRIEHAIEVFGSCMMLVGVLLLALFG